MAKRVITGGKYPTVAIHFVALKTFQSGETKSDYVEGLSYRIRPGNEWLHDIVLGKDGKPGWVQAGKVAITATGGRDPMVAAVGTVKQPEPAATESETMTVADVGEMPAEILAPAPKEA